MEGVCIFSVTMASLGRRHLLMKRLAAAFRPSLPPRFPLADSIGAQSPAESLCNSYFSTRRLLATENTPSTPLACRLATFLSISFATTPTRVTFPFFTMM